METTEQTETWRSLATTRVHEQIRHSEESTEAMGLNYSIISRAPENSLGMLDCCTIFHVHVEKSERLDSKSGLPTVLCFLACDHLVSVCLAVSASLQFDLHDATAVHR